MSGLPGLARATRLARRNRCWIRADTPSPRTRSTCGNCPLIHDRPDLRGHQPDPACGGGPPAPDLAGPAGPAVGDHDAGIRPAWARGAPKPTRSCLRPPGGARPAASSLPAGPTDVRWPCIRQCTDGLGLAIQLRSERFGYAPGKFSCLAATLEIGNILRFPRRAGTGQLVLKFTSFQHCRGLRCAFGSSTAKHGGGLNAQSALVRAASQRSCGPNRGSPGHCAGGGPRPWPETDRWTR
jgi:hypothetical protein